MYVSSALVAVLVMIAVPAVVTALVRRADRKRPPSALVGDEAPGALFTVRSRRWQILLFRIVGIVFVVIGGLVFLVGLATLGDPDTRSALFVGFGIVLFGILFLLIAMGVRRRRVEVFDGHLLVTPWFRAPYAVRAAEIRRLRPSTNRLGGLDIRTAARRGTVTVTAVDPGYPEFCDWLAGRAPDLWNEFVTVYGR